MVSNVSAVPNPQIIDGFVNITCTVSDETIIGGVFVDITGPTGFTPVNASMTHIPDSDIYYYNANYSIEGNYTYAIYTFDTSGNSAVYSGFRFEIINGSFISVDIPFIVGWNLITIPVETGWYASDLANNITGCELVSWFDAENQTFRTHIAGVPGYDFPLLGGWGYFVYVNVNSTFTVVGAPIMNVSVPLEVDWNMIGWYHDYNTTASSIAENITGCELVSWFDAENQTYRTHIAGVPGYDFTVTCGMGLFVYTNEASTWHGEG